MCYYGYGYGPYSSRIHRGYGGRAAWGNGFRSVPVNIVEKEDRYELFLYAPSLVKEKISVTTQGDTLAIKYQSPDDKAEDDNYTRREYRNDSFERSFLLNNKVAAEGLSAAYSEGVLKVVLPKNPAAN